MHDGVYQSLLNALKPEMRISCEEPFAPAIAVTPVADVDEAITLANDSKYGLEAGIFTRDLNNCVAGCP